MVISRSIDFDGVIEQTEGEAGEAGLAFEDEDFVESGQAMNMMEQVQTNPSTKGPKIPWKALRMPGARTAERGAISWIAGMRDLLPGFRGNDIRSSPYAYLITARLWTQYINNMEATDFGAELNAAVSMEERASLYLFAEEWRNDVTHQRFRTRLIDDVSVNAGDEIAKGQMVYDLLTGAIAAAGGQANTQYNRMFRLSMDILQSIRMRYYNYYSVNLLHRDEGSAVYEEFLSRYTPLEAHEVAIIQEIQGGVETLGRAYAAQTTNPVTDSIQNFSLMQRAVETYNIGDTRTARAAIGVLLGAPISYQSSAAYSVNADTYGRPQIVRDDKGGLVQARVATKLKESGKSGINRVFIAKGTSKDGNDVTMTVDNKGIIRDQPSLKGATFIEVTSMGNPTPINYAIFSETGDISIKYLAYKQWQGKIANLSINATAAQETSQQPAGRRYNARNNPSGSRNNPVVNDGWWGFNPGTASVAELKGELKRLKAELAEWEAEPDSNDQDMSINFLDQQIYTVAIELRKRGENPRTKNNPVRIGQGQHFFIELIPKRKMTFNSKQKAFGRKPSAGKGRGPKNPIVGSPTMNDPTGFGDIFGGYEKAGYVAWKGTHKTTGKNLPWMIQLPRKRGKKGGIVFKAAQVTKNGKTYKTIKPFTADKKIKAAWKKFTDYYGEPVFANDAGFKTKFIIPKANRGSFYKRAEPALGKMSEGEARRLSKKIDAQPYGTHGGITKTKINPKRRR